MHLRISRAAVLYQDETIWLIIYTPKIFGSKSRSSYDFTSLMNWSSCSSFLHLHLAINPSNTPHKYFSQSDAAQIHRWKTREGWTQRNMNQFPHVHTVFVASNHTPFYVISTDLWCLDWPLYRTKSQMWTHAETSVKIQSSFEDLIARSTKSFSYYFSMRIYPTTSGLLLASHGASSKIWKMYCELTHILDSSLHFKCYPVICIKTWGKTLLDDPKLGGKM